MDTLFKILFDLIESILKSSFELFDELISGNLSRNRGYNAEFIPARRILSSGNLGFCLTGRRNLTIKDSYQNALIIGGTGVGKSSIVLFPSLYSMSSSFIIHDPSGELLTKSGGYLAQKGYEVKVLNFAKPHLSCGYNPLSRARSLSDIQKLASLLIENSLGKGSKDPFWNTQGSALLTMLITILKKQEPEYQNLYNVRLLLNQLGANPEAVDAVFSRDADEVLFAEYKSFLAYDEKIINGVISTCKAALQIFNDEAVAKVTSYDDIDMQHFRTRPIALFIQNSVADQKYYSVLTSILFEQFFSFVLGRFPKDNEQDIFLLIDEASSLNLPTLPLAVANVRKHRSGIMLLIQDFNQLIHNYGKYDAEAIRSNCFAKMYFTGQSLETARELEAILGKYEYEDDNGKKVIRSLMTNDEIRTIKTRQALLICGNHLPVLATLKPYYKRNHYLKYSQIPFKYVERESVIEQIPSLPLTGPLVTNE